MEFAKEIVLKVSDLYVAFGSDAVLNGVSFEVKRGEVVAIVGPNGAGKSVMFRTLLGLLPYSGEIAWADKVKIGYVPQKLFIEPSFPLSVREFLTFKSHSPQDIAWALASVGIKEDPHSHHENYQSHILNQQIGLLSGGELQRILIAWALVGKPEVLLFDEPTAGIDIGGEETIYTLLHELQDNHDLTVLLISHDLNIVYRYADTVLCLNKNQLCFGDPETVLDPQSLAKLYGGEARFYHHEHSNDHHEH